MSPRIDLHTHSSASDGTQTPTELVVAAVAAGLDVLALTDHDTADGWPEAAAAAEQHGLTLLRGMEISTVHDGASVHLLAYLCDPTEPRLAEALTRIRAGRTDRVPRMVERLRERGSAITVDDVLLASAGTPAPGRPHVADALVTLGEVRDRDEAFARFLANGRPAYVDRYATPLADMVEIVAGAGGASVIAHPWGRHGTTALDADLLADLRERGLSGIEVDHEDHDPDERARLRVLARDLDLVATGSSDHHGLGKTGHDLGCNVTAPQELDRLLARAAAAAAASGRRTPDVVGG